MAETQTCEILSTLALLTS